MDEAELNIFKPSMFEYNKSKDSEYRFLEELRNIILTLYIIAGMSGVQIINACSQILAAIMVSSFVNDDNDFNEHFDEDLSRENSFSI